MILLLPFDNWRNSFEATTNLFDLNLLPGANYRNKYNMQEFFFKLAACRPIEVIFQFLLIIGQKIRRFRKQVFFLKDPLVNGKYFNVNFKMKKPCL